MLKKYLCLTLLIVLPCFAYGDNRDPRIVALVEAAAKSRILLPNEYHLVVEQHWKHAAQKTASGKISPPSEFVRRIMVWSKGESLRTDIQKLGLDVNDEEYGSREIICRNGEFPGYGMMMYLGSRHTVTSLEIMPLGPRFDAHDQFKLDWRGIGMNGRAVGDHANVPMTLLLKQIRNIRPTTIESTIHNNEPCELITMPLRSRWYGEIGTRKIWFAPNRGMNPVRVVDDTSGDGPMVYNTTDIEYQKVAGFDAWYPKKIVYVNTRDDKIDTEETINVLVASFDKLVPDVTFRIIGLNLQNGHSIRLPGIGDDRQEPVMRNGKPDRDYADKVPPLASQDFRAKTLDLDPGPALPYSRPISYFRLLGYVASLVSGFAIVVAYLIRLKRKPKSFA